MKEKDYIGALGVPDMNCDGTVDYEDIYLFDKEVAYSIDEAAYHDKKTLFDDEEDDFEEDD